MQIKATVRGIANLKRSLKAENKRQVKCMETAVKGAGYQLRKDLIKEIKKGAPGGKKLEPLRAITRLQYTATGTKWTSTKPFGTVRDAGKSLASMVRWDIQKGKDYQMAIGWTGSSVSNAWKRIAKKQQEGFTTPTISPEFRRFLAVKGATLSKRSKNRKYFFLKKTTKRFDIPARPIMDPFWTAHKAGVMMDIRRKYKLKLQGKRF